MIDASWILKNFGLNSTFYTQFLKICQISYDKSLYQSAFHNWKKKFDLKFMITNIILLDSNKGNLSENEVFIRYNYAAWIIYKLSKMMCTKISFPEHIWQYFGWFSELNQNSESIFQDNISKLLELEKPLNFSAEDLFGPFLNHILKIDLQEEKGMFYTPKILSDFLSNQVMKIQNIDISSTILDPTCGTGNILIGIYQKIESSSLSTNNKKKFITKFMDLMKILLLFSLH